jgi:hypothetical protein
MEDTSVQVTNESGRPKTYVNITQKGTVIRVSMLDFVEALKVEVHLPRVKFQSKRAMDEKEGALRMSLDEAVQRVINKLKAEAARSPKGSAEVDI